MRTSEKYLEVTKALLKAQRLFSDGVEKNAVNPHFAKSYTDLAGLWKAVKGPLHEAGLLVIQTPSNFEDGSIQVETSIIHVETGEWIEATLRAKPVQAGPQAMGSVITYLKRYTLQALLAIPSEDDDGNAGTALPPQQVRKESKKAAPAAPVAEAITKETLFQSGNAAHENKAMEWLKSKNVPEHLWGTLGVQLNGKPFARIGAVAKALMEQPA